MPSIHEALGSIFAPYKPGMVGTALISALRRQGQDDQQFKVGEMAQEFRALTDHVEDSRNLQGG